MDDDDEEEHGRTLYFDAEEGTLVDADGEEVILEMGSEPSESVDDDEDEEEEEEEDEDGSHTPQAQASTAQQERPTQTITGTFPIPYNLPPYMAKSPSKNWSGLGEYSGPFPCVVQCAN